MSYIQSNNPLSRKTSPINKVNPYEKGLSNTISEDKLDFSGSTSVHPESEHHPKLEGQPMPAGGPYGQDYEHIEDLKEAGVDPEPDYESDDYKSPLYKDEHWIQDATASIKERGTEGKCTPISKPGCTGKARTLALTFKKMAKNR